MDFARSAEQIEIAALARRILTDQVTEDVLRDAEKGAERFHRGVWTALADADLLGVALPVAHGGLGLGILEQCIVLEEVGRTVAPVPVLASIVGGALPIAAFGSAAQQARWLPGAVDGSAILTSALLEPRSRTPERPTTTATPTADGWRLDGVKTCVPAATLAAAILVPATFEGGEVGVFVVETATVGLTIEPQRVTSRDLEGLVTLDGVAVSAGALLGTAHDGARPLPWMVEHSTIGSCAQVSGIVARALELTAAYTRERIQFDRPIATFQAVAQRAADAYIDVEATKLVVLQAAWRLSEGLPAATEVEVAKFWAAEAAHRVAHTAVHLHGGTGVDADHPVHRYFLAAKELEFTLGGATDQLLRIGAAMAADGETDWSA
ncbi:MAG: putative acyl-CoA dehydrogenase [Acidimicrobiales bacterium]|nr:putative acyl-CoA dehydrogenase [Acidimicrobiales bacterium]